MNVASNVNNVLFHMEVKQVNDMLMKCELSIPFLESTFIDIYDLMKHRTWVQFWNQKFCKQKNDLQDIKCRQLELEQEEKYPWRHTSYRMQSPMKGITFDVYPKGKISMFFKCHLMFKNIKKRKIQGTKCYWKTLEIFQSKICGQLVE